MVVDYLEQDQDGREMRQEEPDGAQRRCFMQQVLLERRRRTVGDGAASNLLRHYDTRSEHPFSRLLTVRHRFSRLLAVGRSSPSLHHRFFSFSHGVQKRVKIPGHLPLVHTRREQASTRQAQFSARIPAPRNSLMAQRANTSRCSLCGAPG